MAEYFEREALIGDLTAAMDHRGMGQVIGQTLIRYVKRQPTADVVPVVHGLWMPIRESEMTGWDPTVAGRDPIGGYICSACKEEAVYDCNDEFVLSKYCPNCGAKMDGGADNADD